MTLLIRVCAILLFALTVTAPGFTRAQTTDSSTPAFPLAAYTNDAIWISGMTDEPILFEEPEIVWNPLSWSSDGRYLTYITRDGFPRATLVYDVETGESSQITDASAVWFGATFDSDDSVLTVIPNFDVTYDYDERFYDGREFFIPILHEVHRAPLSGEGELELLGSFVFQAQCQGGPPSPVYSAYWAEAGYNGYEQNFLPTPYGILHTIECFADSTALLDLENGESALLSTELGRIALSPDRSQILGIEDDVLTSVDLATGEVLTYDTPAEPDQVAWGAADDDPVFFSVMTDSDPIMLTQDEAAFIDESDFGFWVFPLDDGSVFANDVTIYRFDRATGASEIVYESYAWAIGRMQVTPDGAYLLFSEIPNLDELLAGAIASGEMEISDDTRAALNATIAPRIYALHLETGEVTLVASGYYLFELNAAAYLAGLE